MINLVAVVGPTASGKTALGVALAQRYHGEIVSADSMQIYREMQIGTAKPSAEEMRGIPHHLMDFVDPAENFSAADYVRCAKPVISGIHARGKLPVLVGGTGLYVRALLENIQFKEAESDSAVRLRLEEEGRAYGPLTLWERLKAVDPVLAEKLHPNNQGRVIRALEVYELTGIPMSEHQRRSRLAPREYNTCMIGLAYRDRQKLYDRINLRVEKMMDAGLLQEAQRLYRQSLSRTARQAIGYKELFRYFDGELSLEEAVDKIKQESRRYAKRQLTWFRREEHINWIYMDDMDEIENLLEICGKSMEICGIL
ncbi:tRNA (adenosine(37)-N6)-dimethylallyltransferase MiaA [Candidatus Soleaferrea massiliensis]|uniref:tRNA (adenosine(37)-N6)-dimethylallyltransferase MiaA n=1 Tax=Candidatus Soleaferrea massiliensis TaxID=1470354 RepID=UPI00058E6059|nr:tRNA (adenosine(37)-N6)-dimethylallyltransferase MiaA [Candidatus Soleaferrea massiliensis]